MTTKIQSGILVYQEDFIKLVSYELANAYAGKYKDNMPLSGTLVFERFEDMANVMVLENKDTGLRFRASWFEVAKWLTGDTALSIDRHEEGSTQVHGAFVMNREGLLEEYIGQRKVMPLFMLDDLQ